ncbi:MAG: type IX secretion system sortase PorU [Bacteroidota bacterium]
MRFLLSFILLAFSFSSFPQGSGIPVNITWKNTEVIISGSDTNKNFSFDNSICEDNSRLPVYRLRIPLNNNERTDQPCMKNTVFIEISDDEQGLLKNFPQQIPDSISIHAGYEISAKKKSAVLSFLPFRINCISGKTEKLLSADITYNVIHASSGNEQKHTYADNSVLAEGTWYRLKIQNEGIYKISYNDLVQQGIDVSSINPLNIRIFGNGGGMLPEGNWEDNDDDLTENAILVEGENDGTFGPDDYILFYGQSSVKWKYDTVQKHFIHAKNYYSDYTYYFLNFGNEQGRRITSQASVTETPDYIITKFDDYLHHEKDSVNLLKSGKEWYGEYFDAALSYSFHFTFSDIDLASEAWCKTNIAARNVEQTSFDILADNASKTIYVSAIPGSPTSDYARFSEDTLKFIPDDNDITVTIEKNTASSIGWVNFIEVNVTRNLSFTSPQMPFRNVSCTGTGNISEFRLADADSSMKIWDITDPENIMEQQYTLDASEAVYGSNTDTLKQFIAFDGTDFYSPVFVEEITNQNLHGLHQPDMVIITYPLFELQAEQIASIHEALDNFAVVVVTPQQVYNEFSSGSPDITAIRNFMRMFYERSGSTGNFPKYLLLFGDGSYDYKDRLSDNSNFVPTYQSFNSLVPVSSYLTDDYFGILDSTEGYYSNGALDIGIGRLPARTQSDAESLVDKIESYLNNNSTFTETNGCNTYTSEITGDWRNMVCFIADDEDNNLHIEQAESLCKNIDSTNHNINIVKIYLDAYQQQTSSQGSTYPVVNVLLNEHVTKGSLIINYTGHGGETGWSHEGILQVTDINSWKNIYNMPAFVTATCEFSRFDEPSRTSAGELVLLNPAGGGIALFTTTRVSFAYSNFNLNKSFCKEAFTSDSTNGYPRLGDIIMKSKIDNGSIVNIRNFVLLGDPALRLSYPENKVITSEVNGHDVNSEPDTLKSYSKCTVKGYIQDGNGQKMVNFNGFIYPAVYDKKIFQTTVANDPQSAPYNFSTQEKIIFKGKSAVTNGDFEFSFIVPKDINVGYGQARISYYAKDSLTHAAGYYENSDFIIGGMDTNAVPDNAGPLIRLFFNDTSFIPGGTTDANPIFIAMLEDLSGVQYTGYGIGHDIVATLDGNTESSYILNDYFTPEINSYSKGEIEYPFRSLPEGEHTLNLKAWDIANNSSEAVIDFIVTKPGDLSLKNIFNYPNPFTENTCFCFEHNQPCCELGVEINIYNVTGMLVKNINETVATTGNKYSTLCWNGRNDSGHKLHSGVYVYKIKTVTGNNSWLESANRLIILR